ncbi:acyltransferase [Rhodoblastus acidophilus]|uniref:Acyltransferase n=1 Tax=Candidatus Rhodoblastus alkanivorans TaxID=2954117 RepID=A0ABS9Z5H3_9HYPH|nr:acyltransferase family protein [Candidatus Rhodoblastus alkanivorans]MCI4679881.1 acyltransferase [Candidatus Rhodoblastus alkanivorans]MCI4682716.1 acyltransferase [Candidatus Rhodoblastus alkanivorans]MDI4640023.1 acyltransferase [Rhodoblastus acidophilus]
MDKLVSGARAGAATKPLGHHDFRPDINGLRALAVLGVVAFHAHHGLLPGGFTGVDVFFVISGFLITRIILSEREAEKFSLLFFYAKRAKRILPALLLVTSFVWVLGWLWADPRQFRMIGGHIEASSYFTVNLWLLRQTAGIGGYFDIASNSKPLLHLWSLSIEEQFYLFWPATMLLLFSAGRRWLGPGIALIFALSLAFCLYETPRDPSAAFYLPWTRAWELALGALLAWREVFILHRAPHPERPWADVGAGLGVALICASYVLLDETQAFPGWRALAPALGSALVIAFPGSRIGAYVLGNRVAQFFGLISYPLYLWHWPLFAFAHIRPGVTPDGATMAALSALAVVLAYLTWRFVERPVGHLFRRRPRAVALALVALLGVTGVVGSATRVADGVPNRFPPEVVRIFNYTKTGADLPRLQACFYQREEKRFSLEEERRRAASFFEANHCGVIADPRKPTIMIVGDSHAAVLFVGLEHEFAGRANVVAMTATYCMPLIENTPMDQGAGGTPRCHAINQYVFRQIRAIKPDVLVVGAYFASYASDHAWLYPNYFNDFLANVHRLHKDGVKNIVIAGEIPTWSPFLPILVGLDVNTGKKPPEFSAIGLRPESRAADARLKKMDWGPGATYVSQAAKLCRAGECRRLVGDKLPEDMIAVDYGHYSFDGSIFAVKNILAPVIDPLLGKARGN